MNVHYLAEAGVAPDPACLAGLEDLKTRARRAAAVAALHAAAVDAEARFPAEALGALKAERLLGAMVPAALGGEGASVAALAEVCYILGGACASSAMIFAMHQIKAACLVRHGLGEPWMEDFLRRVARDQLLLASSTTEGRSGGDVRNSLAPIQRRDGAVSLERAASVMSYGLEADAVVTTARRDEQAASSDQVLAVFERSDYVLTNTHSWETLGMRGTRSAGFALSARGQEGQILSVPYADIHIQTMAPVAHSLWSSVWAGVSAFAVERARRHLRKAVRAAPDQTPIGMTHFAQASAALNQLRVLATAGLRRYEALKHLPEEAQALRGQTAVALLKVETSELAVQCVLAALRSCGLEGYRNDGDASLGRALRDILSAPIMINNERILANMGLTTVLLETPTGLLEAYDAAPSSGDLVP